MIRWWLGYVKSEFYAAAVDSKGREYVVARSKAFPWRKSDPPPKENKDVRAAFDALSGQLVQLGWKRVVTGLDEPWYDCRFTRERAEMNLLEATAAGVSALRDRVDVFEAVEESRPALLEDAYLEPPLKGRDLEPDPTAASLRDKAPLPAGLASVGGHVTLRLDAVRRRVLRQVVLEVADRLDLRGETGRGLAARIRECVEADAEYDLAVWGEERVELLAVLEELKRESGLPSDLNLLWLTLATPGLLVG